MSDEGVGAEKPPLGQREGYGECVPGPLPAPPANQDLCCCSVQPEAALVSWHRSSWSSWWANRSSITCKRFLSRESTHPALTTSRDQGFPQSAHKGKRRQDDVSDLQTSVTVQGSMTVGLICCCAWGVREPLISIVPGLFTEGRPHRPARVPYQHEMDEQEGS